MGPATIGQTQELASLVEVRGEAVAPGELLWIEPQPTAVAQGARGETPFRRHFPRIRHPIRLLLIVIPSLVLMGVAYVFLSYALRPTPGPKSMQSAVNAFRGGHDTKGAVLRYQLPAQGVYQLKGHGTERISFPPNSQNDGAVMPASVTYLDGGCWRWHLDYNVAHWEEYNFCPNARQLVQPVNRNYQSWNFGTMAITNLSTFSCPATTVVLDDAPVAGQVSRWTCTGTSSAIRGSTTSHVVMEVRGSTTISIGDARSVRAVHEVQTTTLRGAQTGSVVENWWFSASSGLPLRVDRQIQILTASPLGTITYREAGSWQLASLAPRS
jgi:hypothetical protein